MQASRYCIALTACACLLAFVCLPPSLPPPPAGAILVSGAGSGLGLHTAQALAARLPSHRVYGLVRSEEAAQKLARVCGGRVRFFAADLTDARALAAAVHALQRALAHEHTQLVGVFDSAGVAMAKQPVEYLDVARLRRVYDVDVFGLVALLQHVAPLLRRSKGRLCVMGSVTGVVTPAFMAMDAARAIETVADAARRELRPWGVGVSVVQAGYVRSPVLGKTEAEEHRVLNSTAGREMLSVYPALARKIEAESALLAGDGDLAGMDVVSDAVYDAMTSSRPSIRYIVGTVPSPVPTWLLVPLLHVLPHHVLDWFE